MAGGLSWAISMSGEETESQPFQGLTAPWSRRVDWGIREKRRGGLRWQSGPVRVVDDEARAGYKSHVHLENKPRQAPE